ncbi:50S ribosomal protein L29 [bacterium]|jgi:large subunit ribosomal protein L29|nr:50S ribosomal protein L29 [bacterium]MBT4335103.1 50S ribosomal protein L29 [bacterium]MBT4495266.1 50S ribosomal protein L29 [bacterium]MBT4763890.1 50S ribosomal protein L29 [bacterium]MBT5401261.1 50S ribosomal protein L29 [bacterium]
MELKEFRTKTEKELKKLLAQNREKLRSLRFSVSSKQLKNIREIRIVRKEVSRILTVLKDKVAENIKEDNK